MAKLYFYYSAMNAGKTTHLLQSNYNYKERGMHTLVLSSAIDDRFGRGVVRSRIGIETPSIVFNQSADLLKLVQQHMPLDCVLLDEAQFLSRAQVYQLTEVVDQLNIPVLAYGLRTDFQGELFEGSQYLLAWADELNELKTICHTGKKAIMVIRIDENGRAVKTGNQIQVGGNDRYVSVSRGEYKRVFHDRGVIKPSQISLPLEDAE